MSAQPGSVNPPVAGMELLVEFGPDTMIVLRASPLAHVPQLHLHSPALTEENLPNLASGLSEVVLTFLDASDRSIQSFGFPVPGRRYVDFGDPKAGTLRGGPRPIPTNERDVRALRIPWTEQVAFLFFHRCDVFESAAGLTLRRRGLLVVLANPDQDQLPRSLPHGLPLPPRVQLPLAPPWQGKPRPLPWLIPDAVGLDGQIVSATTPVDNGDPSARFDIVITGDGFSAQELPVFDALADQLMNGMAGMEPFLTMSALINWHIVRVASTDSGINCCPNPVPSVPPKRTFFGVEGCWDNTGVPGFLGTRHPERIQWAAEQVAPWEDIELVIVIANCGVWGGHAWPGWKTAIVTTSSYLYFELASHECGHVISELAEEYIVCVKDNLAWPDPNKARLPQVARSVLRHVGGPGKGGPWAHDTIWWRDLATWPGERTAGAFNAVLTVVDPIVSTDGISPDPKPGQQGFIGAFWGCQDAIALAQLQHFIKVAPQTGQIDVEPLKALLESVLGVGSSPADGDPGFCDPFWDPRSAFYFRPSASCRMRHPRYPFCRVCRHLIGNSILEAAGSPPIPPLPPQQLLP